MYYVQNYTKRVNMYVVFDKKRLVSKILVWFELVCNILCNKAIVTLYVLEIYYVLYIIKDFY